MNGTMRWIPALGAAAIAAACGGGGDGGDSGSGAGTLKVSLTDAPACGYDNVWVTVTKVRVHRSDAALETDSGWSEVLVDPTTGGRRIDLLELQNGVLAELGQLPLSSGHYSQVRLVLADNATLSGANQLMLSDTKARVSLDTPSAQQSGLKLKHGFDIEVGATADLVLDFDACRSIVKAGNSGKYNLKPVIAVIPSLTGSITGSVDPQAARANASVSLQRFDPSSGVVSVVRATTAKADGTWTLSPVPALPSGEPGYNLVIGAADYGNVVYTRVPVATGVATATPHVTLEGADERTISGRLPISVSSNGEVQALQTVVAAGSATAPIVIQAAFANADSLTGEYVLRVPAQAVRVAPLGENLVPGAVGGIYVVKAKHGDDEESVEADVSGGDIGIDFSF